MPLAPRVSGKAGLGELARLFPVGILLETIRTDERRAGASLRLVVLQVKLSCTFKIGTEVLSRSLSGGHVERNFRIITVPRMTVAARCTSPRSKTVAVSSCSSLSLPLFYF